jgi:cellulose synthase/poly-beta-1,6-N-acetylglucosamine synthase-like glycosyltransferase
MTLELLQLAIYYFLTANFIYGALIVFSWMKISKYQEQETHFEEKMDLPPITFIISAFNEESVIVETTQTYLSLPIKEKEIIIINDGSNDCTFKVLQVMFQLERSNPNSNLFRSITVPELKVLEAAHLGKARALNLGISHARTELICTMDADTIPSSPGVIKVLKEFARDSKLLVAGGVIQVLKSSTLLENEPASTKKQRWLNSFQSIEYIRAFLCERLGWSFLGATVLVSGAFCMMRREALLRVGGFQQDSIAEDFDLILRMRRIYSDKIYHFKIFPITTCYTQAPRTLKHLKGQRIRWQRGLLETLINHRSMIFDFKQGLLGFIVIPYYWLFEVLSPLIELITLMLLILTWFQGHLSLPTVILYLGIGLAYNLFITLFGIYIDNKFVTKKYEWSFTKSLISTIILNLGYRQIISWWRLTANIKTFMIKKSWGEKPRQEIIHLHR